MKARDVFDKFTAQVVAKPRIAAGVILGFALWGAIGWLV